MKTIITRQFDPCKDCKFYNKDISQSVAHSLSFRAIPSAAFRVSNLIPTLATHGFALLPGLTQWLDVFSPLIQREAWSAFANNNVAEIIRSHPMQQQRFFLNDSNQLDSDPQLSVNFVEKLGKSHLTIVEGAEAIGDCPFLPATVQTYLKNSNGFIRHVRDIMADLLPQPTLPTVLKMRVFEYHASDQSKEAMRPHIDGSVCTLIIAQSDGLLHFAHQGQWYSAIRPDKKPFAMMIPGVAAKHDYGIAPTPHMVLVGAERRVSVTIFLTPELSTKREVAQEQAESWRSLKCSNEVSLAA